MSENNGAAPIAGLEQVGISETMTKEKFVSIAMAVLHKIVSAAGGVVAIKASEVEAVERGAPVGFDIKLIQGVYAIQAEAPAPASRIIKAPASMANRLKGSIS